jgi:hypothetical protein
MFFSMNLMDIEVMRMSREDQSRSLFSILRHMRLYGPDNIKNNRI